MRPLFLLFLFTAPFVLYAQDVTGVWQGHFRSAGSSLRSSMFDDRYKFEVQIAQTNKKFEAVTYSYLSTIFYGKAAASGSVNPATGKVFLQEGRLLEVRNQSGDVCTMTCFLQYTKSGEEEFLEGTYVSMNTRDSGNCGRGTVFLRKVTNSDFYKEPFLVKREKEIASKGIVQAKPPKAAPAVPAPSKTPAGPAAPNTAATPAKPKPESTPKSAPPMARVTLPGNASRSTDSSIGVGRNFSTIVPEVLRKRSNPLVKTITVHSNEVTINIYDDGAIDHDTVSVYLDNRPVISRAMLTDRPLTLTLHLDENNDYHELVMVAENEGEIPPNTSLMIVKAGDKEYEVRITSTEQKNAVVAFKYAK